jgi:hypothetical protein
VLEFLGLDAQDAQFSGQVYLMTAGGYGYWVFTWAPAGGREALAEQWESLRQGFALLGERKGWTPKPRGTAPFTGTAVPYQLNYATDLWRKQEKAEDSDRAVELELRGFELLVDEDTGRKKVLEHAGRAATVQVLVLPRAASLDAAEQAAKEHVLKRERALHEQAKFEPVKDKKSDQPITSAKVGHFAGRLSKLELRLSADTSRYVVLGVVERGDKVLALCCECPWDRRDYWEQEFRDLLATVRERR